MIKIFTTLLPLLFSLSLSVSAVTNAQNEKPHIQESLQGVPVIQEIDLDPNHFINLLINHDFGTLEKKINLLQARYERDTLEEKPLVDALKVFGTPNPDHTMHLDAWVNHSPMPPAWHEQSTGSRWGGDGVVLPLHVKQHH